MITTTQKLKYYLYQDLARFDHKKPGLKDYIIHNEVWFLYNYQKHLRYVEFYKNTKRNKILYLYHFFMYKRLGFKLRIIIYPNTIGPGLRIYHTGDLIHIKANCLIGKNSTLQPGVVIGNKYIEEDDSRVAIGDNCYLGLGVKIFGELKIGNNVIIGANSVVTKDIPDNCVVGGIPAKIIKRNGLKEINSQVQI